MTSDQGSFNLVTSENPNFSKSRIVQWHLLALFSRKMIPAETMYEPYNQELQAILEALKTWIQYLEG